MRPGRHGSAQWIGAGEKGKHVNAVRWFVVLALLIVVSTGVSSSSAASGSPAAGRVESKITGDVARFSIWFEDPSGAWESTFNQPWGWMAVVFVAPGRGSAARYQYQIDGCQAYDGSLPVFRFEHPDLFVYSPPEEVTPITGQASVRFWDNRFTVDVPVSALGGDAKGLRYQVQLYSVLPVDPLLAMLQPGAAYPGTVDDNSPTVAHFGSQPRRSPTEAPETWGSLRLRYR